MFHPAARIIFTVPVEPAGLGSSDVAGVGLLSLGMCALAGTLALRKVQLLDPAELF